MLYSTGELSAANQLILPMECTWNYTSESNIITRLPVRGRQESYREGDVMTEAEVKEMNA